jgi:endonuclease/exonuclease/phosphatase family metal-dependent hydrolase
MGQSETREDCLMHDYVIVGAGLFGSVLAERIANVLDKSVLVIEKRDHIAGINENFQRIDWILTHKSFSCESISLEKRASHGLYPSDHFPVTTTISW